MEQTETIQPKKRGRKPKTDKMTESEIRETVASGNMSLGGETYMDFVEKPKEEEDLISAEQSVPEDSKTEENTEKTAKDSLESISRDNIKAIASVIAKSEKYVENRLSNLTNINAVLGSLVSMLKENCLPAHKYNIGDWVYIPEQTVDNTSGGFEVIKVEFRRKPRRVQINKIIYTNKIQYSFVGFKKLVVLEEYCCSTEAQCQALCDRMNK